MNPPPNSTNVTTTLAKIILGQLSKLHRQLHFVLLGRLFDFPYATYKKQLLSFKNIQLNCEDFRVECSDLYRRQITIQPLG